VPLELSPEGLAQVVVRQGERFSTPKTIRLAEAAPGLLTESDGWTVARREDGALVTAETPLKAGERLTVYLTGLGATEPALATGEPAGEGVVLRTLPEAWLGGVAMRVVGGAAQEGSVGLYRVLLEVPEGVAAGDQVLLVRQGGVAANEGKIPVRP